MQILSHGDTKNLKSEYNKFYPELQNIDIFSIDNFYLNTEIKVHMVNNEYVYSDNNNIF